MYFSVLPRVEGGGCPRCVAELPHARGGGGGRVSLRLRVPPDCKPGGAATGFAAARGLRRRPRQRGTAAAGPALPQGRCWEGPAGCSAVMAAGPAAPRVLNVNVGVLGHIDSGKTALARALSTTGSTAAFDRAPQSRARGITLDLGFSCLRTALPPQLGPGPGELQFTLVDCPGHASLIRTIIGGKGGGGERRWPPLPGPGVGETPAGLLGRRGGAVPSRCLGAPQPSARSRLLAVRRAGLPLPA